MRVTAAGATPRGTAQIVIRRAGRVVRFISRRYRPGFTAYTGRLARRGRYRVTARFIPFTGSSPFRSSHDTAAFRVVRR